MSSHASIKSEPAGADSKTKVAESNEEAKAKFAKSVIRIVFISLILDLV